MPQIDNRKIFVLSKRYDSQISNASNYTYLGSTISSNGSSGLSKQIATEKTIFNTKKYLDFYKLPITTWNKLFDALFSPILLYNSEIWGTYEKINFDKWETDCVEKLHTQLHTQVLLWFKQKSSKRCLS